VQALVQIGLVAVGSAVGGVARWGATVLAARVFGTAFPWGTFVINVSGSFFLGWFMTLLTERLPNGSLWLRPEDLRLMVAVGFTGAFTTFSTFEYESHGLLRDKDSLAAILYLAGSLLLGLFAVHFGIALARGK